MPKGARTHDEARAIICCCCGKKNAHCSKENDLLEQVIKEEVFKGYDVKDVYFPSGVCGVCRKNLFLAKKHAVVPEVVCDRWNSIDYEQFRPPSRKNPCGCQICKIARYKGLGLEGKELPNGPRIAKEEVEDKEA